MTFEELIRKVGNLPVVDTDLLLAGVPKPESIKVQISRWQKTGKLVKLKRGIYLLAEPYRRVEIYEPYLASLLQKPSYISLEKALEYHGLIPEAVPTYTSVTTKRQGRFVTRVGTFDYRHIQPSLFWGYDSVTVRNQTAFIAVPEKALLDLIYLKWGNISSNRLTELRLQNLDRINIKKLVDCAKHFNKQSILRSAEKIKNYIHFDKEKRL